LTTARLREPRRRQAQRSASDGQLHSIEVALPAADNSGFRVGLGMWDTDTTDLGDVDDVLVAGVAVQ